ncbi:MAG: hypothetical protein AB7L90_25765 [Hyphomicrobiaceae bacterium]
MDRREWKKRFTARYKQLTSEPPPWLRDAAIVAANEQEDLHGPSGVAWESPEAAAERIVEEEAEDD